ncbi:YybH family protein [Aurantivibrio plasticivorans]
MSNKRHSTPSFIGNKAATFFAILVYLVATPLIGVTVTAQEATSTQRELQTTYSESLLSDKESADIIANIESAREAYYESYSSGDAKKLSELYHKDGSYTVAGVTTQGIDKIIEILVFAVKLDAKLTLTVKSIEMTTPDNIIEQGVYNYSAETPRQFNFSSTYQLEWQKQDDKWLIKNYIAYEPEMLKIPDLDSFSSTPTNSP